MNGITWKSKWSRDQIKAMLIERFEAFWQSETGNEIYYYTSPENYEVDFYLPDRGQLIQVTQHMKNPATRASH